MAFHHLLLCANLGGEQGWSGKKIAQGEMGASDSLKLDLKITSRKRNPFPNTEIFGKSILIEQTT